MLEIWTDQFRFLLIVILKYLADETYYMILLSML